VHWLRPHFVGLQLLRLQRLRLQLLCLRLQLLCLQILCLQGQSLQLLQPARQRTVRLQLRVHDFPFLRTFVAPA
jgi:hypothetical protein